MNVKSGEREQMIHIDEQITLRKLEVLLAFMRTGNLALEQQAEQRGLEF